MGLYTFHNIAITGLASAVPEKTIQTKESADNCGKTTAFEHLRISSKSQTSSDLGFEAASAIVGQKQLEVSEIGCLLFVSRTPDYRSPATATVLHNRLNLSVDCIAYDINIGGAGFVYGLQMGCSILDTINKPYALVVIGDTISKQFSDKAPGSLTYGDGTSAILLEKKHTIEPIIINSQASSSGIQAFFHEAGGFRVNGEMLSSQESIHNNKATVDGLIIDEEAMNNFIISEIPKAIKQFLKQQNTTLTNYDFVALQPVNEHTLKQIAELINMPYAELPLNFEKFGNTSGNAIPLLLVDKLTGQKKKHLNILAVGFGEGFSWGIASFTMDANDILPLIETDAFYNNGVVSHIF